jgi:hypothetical protein
MRDKTRRFPQDTAPDVAFMRDEIRKLLKEGDDNSIDVAFPNGPVQGAYLDAWSELLQHGCLVSSMEANGRTVGSLRYCFPDEFQDTTNQAAMISGIIGRLWQASVWLNNRLGDNVLRLNLLRVRGKGAKE